MNTFKIKLIYLLVFLFTTINTVGVVIILKYLNYNYILILETLFIIQCLSMIDYGLLTSSLRNYNNFNLNHFIKEKNSENFISYLSLERLDFYSVNMLILVGLSSLVSLHFLIEVFQLTEKYNTKIIYLIQLSVFVFILKQYIVNRSISFGEINKVKSIEFIILFLKFIIFMFLIFTLGINFEISYYLITHSIFDLMIIMYFLLVYKFSKIKVSYQYFAYHIYHLHYNGFKNSVTAISGFFINFIVSMVIVGMPNTIEKEMYLMMARLNNLTRYISQVNIISSLPQYYESIGKYGYSHIYQNFRKKNHISIVLYILLSTMLLTLLNAVYEEFYLSLYLLTVFFIIEINQSNHAQIVLSKNTSPFLLVSIITSTSMFVLLRLYEGQSITDMVVLQLICVLFINSWYSFYVLKKEMRNESY